MRASSLGKMSASQKAAGMMNVGDRPKKNRNYSGPSGPDAGLIDHPVSTRSGQFLRFSRIIVAGS